MLLLFVGIDFKAEGVRPVGQARCFKRCRRNGRIPERRQKLYNQPDCWGEEDVRLCNARKNETLPDVDLGQRADSLRLPWLGYASVGLFCCRNAFEWYVWADGSRSHFLGILPVDQLRDPIPPVQLLCQRVPRGVLEALYSIILPKPADFEDPNTMPTAHEFLTTLAYVRGFMSEAGVPDGSRAARIVLKDVFNGKIKWTAAPPGVAQTDFDRFTYADVKSNISARTGEVILDQLKRKNYLDSTTSRGERVDDGFFGRNAAAAHVKGRSAEAADSKKHFKPKKDKLRRVHVDLDA